jgi:restriction system protein
MARRKHSVIADVFEISSMLPWWVGVSLAVVAYLFFHHIATQEIVASMEPGQIGKVAGRQFFKAIAIMPSMSCRLYCWAAHCRRS